MIAMIRKLADEYKTAFRSFSTNSKRFLLVSFIFQLGTQMLGFLFTLYMKNLGYDEEMCGNVMGAQRIGAAVIVLPVSWLVARFGSSRMIAASFALCAVAAGAQVATGDLGTMALAGFFLGCFSTIVSVYSGPYLLRNSTPAERVHLFSVNGSIIWVAGILGTFSGYVKDAIVALFALDGTLAYRLVMAGGIGFMLLAVGLALRCAKRPAAGEAPASPADEPVVAASAEAPTTSLPERDAANEELRGKALALRYVKLLLPGLLVGIGAGMTIPYISLYFKSAFELSDSAISTISIAGQLCTFIGISVGPALARRKGKAWVIFATQSVSVPFILAITYASFLPFVVVAYMARQAFMNMSGPISDNFALEKVPPSQQHFLNALKMLLWTGSWALAVFISGMMIKGSGYALSFTITAALYAVSSALFGIFWRGDMRADKARLARKISLKEEMS